MDKFISAIITVIVWGVVFFIIFGISISMGGLGSVIFLLSAILVLLMFMSVTILNKLKK